MPTAMSSRAGALLSPNGETPLHRSLYASDHTTSLSAVKCGLLSDIACYLEDKLWEFLKINVKPMSRSS